MNDATIPASAWDPDRYLTYADERGRPFVDLLARVPAVAPAVVVDLGCGPGNMTTLLAERWPGAEITAVDNSPEMLAKAEGLGLATQLADVRDWVAQTPAGSVDVLISNAMLQWVPGHLDLLPELAAAVAPGGRLAFQVPGNFGERSHTLREEVGADPAYASYLAHVERPASHDPAEYWRVLADAGFEVDAWETTYLHVLKGDDPVFEWISGTSLRPFKAALPDDLWPAFADELKARLRDAYPAADGRVLLPFRRIFVVARRP